MRFKVVRMDPAAARARMVVYPAWAAKVLDDADAAGCAVNVFWRMTPVGGFLADVRVVPSEDEVRS